MSLKYLPKHPAILILSDGTIFYGNAAGKIGTTLGEICFNTGMTGYQEIFTDPSYFGQIVIQTNAHIGNYGAKNMDAESGSVKISGLITKNFTNAFSRIQADSSLHSYLVDENIIAISNLDTRALVQHIRHKGAMNCIISSETLDIEALKKKLSEAPNMDGLELSSIVSTKESYTIGDPNSSMKIAALDFGIKNNILKCLTDRGCFVKVYPAKTTFEEMKEFQANGYFLSNGPGDPAAMDYAVQTTKDILAADKPLFGICLGNQLLALAAGLRTFKMHHGHRGLNHPVKNIETGYCEITSQNHGFGIDEKTMSNNADVKVTHINLNDKSIEGIRLQSKKAFSVQYHPESSPGPHDSRYLFDNFIASLS